MGDMRCRKGPIGTDVHSDEHMEVDGMVPISEDDVPLRTGGAIHFHVFVGVYVGSFPGATPVQEFLAVCHEFVCMFLLVAWIPFPSEKFASVDL